MSFGGRQRKKVVQVPLDTSGIINLNHLDVFPMNFLGRLSNNCSISIDLKSAEQSEDTLNTFKGRISSGISPKNTVAVTINSDGKSSDRKTRSNLKTTKRRTRALPIPAETSEKPTDNTHSNARVSLSPSFDRHGRMTRVTADYNQDSENSQHYKQMRLGRKKLSKLSERQESIFRNYFNNIDYSTVTSEVSSDEDIRVQGINKNEPVQYTSECITTCLNFLDNYDFDHEPENSSEFEKLTEALHQLENSCKSELLFDPSQVPPMRDRSKDILTLCPTKPIPFKCESSITQVDSSLPDYLCCGNNNYKSFENGKLALHEQRAADTWDWVSPAYSAYRRDAVSRIDQISFDELILRSQPTLAHRNVLEEGRQDAYSYGDNPLTQDNSDGKQTSADETFLDLKTIRSTADELPINRRTIFAPITAAIQDMLMNTAKTQQVTPPATSSWSVSPIYEADSELKVLADECTKNKRKPDRFLKTRAHDSHDGEKVNQIFSNCSLAAEVSSVVSLADVHSSEDIPTRCSSNSTFSDFNDGDRDASESLSAMNDQRVQELLTEFSRQEEKRKPANFSRCVSTIAHNDTDSVCNPELPPVSTKSPTPQMKGATSCSKSTINLFDQNTPKVCSTAQNTSKSVEILSETQTAASNIVKAKTVPPHSKISDYSMSKKSRRKKEDKKKDKVKKSKRHKDDKEDTEMETKDYAHHHKDSVTQTLAEQSIQKLKNALPRTPGGRYSLEGKAAEEAIAAYVKAELAASLECAEAIRSRNSKIKIKPAYENLAEFLRRVALNDSKHKKRLNKGHLSCSKVSVKSTGVKSKVPKYASKPRPMIHERPKNIILPRQSNRVNFIRYQQQSLAAMMHYSKSRSSKKASADVGAKDSMKMAPLNAKDYVDRSLAKKGGFNNRFKGNRNMVTVVFDKTLE